MGLGVSSENVPARAKPVISRSTRGFCGHRHVRGLASGLDILVFVLCRELSEGQNEGLVDAGLSPSLSSGF